MKNLYRAFLFALLAVASHAMASGPIRVLIVDGQNNHNWKATTPELKSELLSSGLFQVDIATTPPLGSTAEQWKKFDPDFSNYDVVLLNYFGEDWPAPTLKALEDYVAGGGGLVAFHAGGSSFSFDPAYNKMIGMGWHKRNFGLALALDKNGNLIHIAQGSGGDSGHGEMDPFTVDTRAPDHPIMQGFPAHWTHLRDELYHTLRGPAENVEILATAHSPITGLEEPMAWTVRFGKGRVFYTALGHDVTAMQCFGFQNLMARGLEWAALGRIETHGLLKPFPETIEKYLDPKVSFHADGYVAVKLPITHGVTLHNPTAIAVGPDRKIYAANYTGQIYRLEDTDGDGLEDTAVLVADITKEGKQYPYADAKDYPGLRTDGGLRYPTALAFKGYDMYVTSTQEIRVYHLNKDGSVQSSNTFATGWPFNMHYFDWTFGLAFGPDGWLYTNLTTDYINKHPAPDPKGLRGAMIRISPDGKTFERYAYGLRFSYGIAFNEAGDLFCTDNEGGDNPAEKFNQVIKGGNYGHHPKLPTGPKIPPLIWITPHLSTDGLTFNRSTNDFGGTGGDAFIALWGPDGQYEKGGVTRVRLTKKPDGSYEAKEYRFSDGPPKVINLCFGPQGDLYLAHFGRDYNPGHLPWPTPDGDIYRVIYAPGYKFAVSTAPASDVTLNPLKGIINGNAQNGAMIAQQRACLTCHTVDGSGTKLGPDWKNLWAGLGRGGILKKIADPSKSIVSGYEPYQLITTTGSGNTVGRLLSSEEDTVTLLSPGNIKRTYPRSEIKSLDLLPMSMMPPNLTAGLSDSQVNDLLVYIRSLGGAQTAPDIRIKPGNHAVTDADGVTWQPDVAYKPGFYGYTGGQVASPDDTTNNLAATCRFGNFTYDFDADNGDYEVTLVFGEMYFKGPGQRTFDVSINGQSVIKDLDVLKEVGFLKELRRSFPVHVTGGKITISFTGGKAEAIVNAIEVKPLTTVGESSAR